MIGSQSPGEMEPPDESVDVIDASHPPRVVEYVDNTRVAANRQEETVGRSVALARAGSGHAGIG